MARYLRGVGSSLSGKGHLNGDAVFDPSTLSRDLGFSLWGLEFSGLGFRVQASGFSLQFCLGFRVQGIRFAQGSGFRVEGFWFASEFKAYGGFWIQSLGFRVEGLVPGSGCSSIKEAKVPL